MRAMVMIHTHAKSQDQRSLGSKVKVETDRRIDGWTENLACHMGVLLFAAVNYGDLRT